MNRDPKYFPDYEEFRPERYLDESGQLNDEVPDTHHQGHLSFGCGRRHGTRSMIRSLPYADENIM